MQGIIQKLQGEFTDDTLPRFYPNDPMINKGTAFMFDMKNPICYPSQTVGAVPSGTTLANLVTGSPSAVVQGAALTFTAGGGMKLDNSGGQITMGNNNYDLNVLGNPNFRLGIWLKFPGGADENTTAYRRIFGRFSNSTAGNMQAGFDSGANGKTPRGQLGNATAVATKSLTGNVNVALDVVVQLEIVYENGFLNMFQNGVLQGSAIAFTPPFSQPSAALAYMIGDWVKGTVYRWYMENLTLSGKSGAAQCALEYTKNLSKFS